MARATDPRLEKIRTAIALAESRGYPEELIEMFTAVNAAFDAAGDLIALFGVVDEASAARAWELYEEFAETYARHPNNAGRPTLH